MIEPPGPPALGSQEKSVGRELKTFAFCALVVIMSTIVGMIFGSL
jgi:hypothetical protein